MRFSEMESFKPTQMDFVPRERRNQITLLTFSFVVTMVIILISGYTPIFKQSDIYTPLIAIVLIGVLCLYVLYNKQVGLDLVMSTEYQNLLFSKALSLGSTFCIITQRDGTIIYASEGIDKVFSNFGYAQAQALGGVFEQGVVLTADRERIMGAIRSGSNDNLIFPIFNRNNEKKDYILTVEPLPRPGGYSLVRGREYFGNRTGTQMLPDLLRSTSIDKIDHMLATSPIAHYTTDAFGRFEYVNPAFEQLFAYKPEVILLSKLRLHHLFISFGSTTITEEYSLADYMGEATIIRQDGSQHRFRISQMTVRDNQRKILGATGTLMPMNAN